MPSWITTYFGNSATQPNIYGVNEDYLPRVGYNVTAVPGMQQNVIEYCTKVHKAGPAGTESNNSLFTIYLQRFSTPVLPVSSGITN